MVSIDSEIRIRPFVPGDQDIARQIILEGLGEHFGFVDASLNPDLNDIDATYVKNGHLFLVAEQSGRLIATGALVTETGDEARIVRLSVVTEKRGLGIGRSMVNKLVERARQRSFRRIVVETNHDWYPAIKLYKSCGFTVYATDCESVHLHRPI